MTRPWLSILACSPLVLGGCGNDAKEDEGETGDSSTSAQGDGDGDPAGDGDGDGEGDGDGDGEGDGDGDAGLQPPSLDQFLVNGSASPGIVEAAGPITVEVEASDSDGSVVGLRVYADGELFEMIEGEGPFVSQFPIGGEQFNGTYAFSVTVIDSDGLETSSEEIALGVQVSPGGTVMETWTFDGGENDVARRLLVNAEGTELIVGGTQMIDGINFSRIERLVGEEWSDKTDSSSPAVAGLAAAQNGEFLMVGDGEGPGIRLFRYDATGSLLEANEIALKRQSADASLEESALQLDVDGEGNFYILGSYWITGSIFYLHKFSPDGTRLWGTFGDDESLSDATTTGRRLDIGSDRVVVTGWQGTGMNDSRVFMADYALADGAFQSEITFDDYGLGTDIAIEREGGILLGGTIETDSDWQTWRARYGAAGQLQWTGTGESVVETNSRTIAVEIDPFGDNIVMSLENCVNFAGCELHVRKYDADDQEMWDYEAPSAEFLTQFPLTSDIVVDRYGYIYVTATGIGQGATQDWWTVKLHP